MQVYMVLSICLVVYALIYDYPICTVSVNTSKLSKMCLRAIMWSENCLFWLIPRYLLR